MTTAAQPAKSKALAPNRSVLVPRRSDWAVGPITNGKAKYTLPADWREGALHHKISKEKLSSIAEQLTLLYYSPPGELQDAVRGFWALCWELAGGLVTEAVQQAEPKVSAHRLLWNLPVNLSLGPKNPANDPGQAFDPDTVPDPETPGRRLLDGASDKLRQLEKEWDLASERASGQGEFSEPALWHELTRLLREARQEADRTARREDGRLLYRPMTEQWLIDGKSHLRKGTTEFLDAAVGEQRFREERLNAPSIAAHKESRTVLAAGKATTAYKGKPVTLTVTITGEVVHHVGERHTFTFFDFRGRNRSITTLWEKIPDFAALTKLATELAPHLARSCLSHLVDLEVADAADWPNDDIEMVQQPAGERCVYFRAGIEDIDEDDNGVTVDVRIKTFAPNGSSGPGLLRTDLATIETALTARP
ncbi:hypothetical protein ACFYNO_20155 [Kitasatospora sp. NPDC006697]|uniref:hypothetical protein n=1 Tax=Kitasatospora sp. NPDC006697 TaxID=3364020 RepID=UPI00369CB4D3